MRLKTKIFGMLLIVFSSLYTQENSSEVPMIPMVPMIPATPNEKVDDITNKKRVLEKVSTIMGKMEVDIIVPMEIISDVDIKALVIDDENLEIPFDIEFNKKPDIKNYYSLNFSSTQLDIDDDGIIDTEIFSPKFVNERVTKDNYVKITGKNISKEGTHKKRVYITVEVRE